MKISPLATCCNVRAAGGVLEKGKTMNTIQTVADRSLNGEPSIEQVVARHANDAAYEAFRSHAFGQRARVLRIETKSRVGWVMDMDSPGMKKPVVKTDVRIRYDAYASEQKPL